MLGCLLSVAIIVSGPLQSRCAFASGDVKPGAEFHGRDSLQLDEDPGADAQQCLSDLRWTPAEFAVRCETPAEGKGDFLVRFPSPIDTNNKRNDLVAMEWYLARNGAGEPIRAPGVVVVHESGRSMPVGRMIARGLRSQGLHAFLIQLPGYGVRRAESEPAADQLVPVLRQAIADVRRARDAVAALPLVNHDVIGLQGTSLGGFVASTVAGLDRGYDRVFILLAGGNLHEVIEQGNRDAEKLRQRLSEAGLEGESLRALVRTVEPLRLAHRIDPHRMWLYSGKFDDVVPPASSRALATAAQLPADHHIELAADHYSGILLLPTVLLEIRQRMLAPE